MVKRGQLVYIFTTKFAWFYNYSTKQVLSLKAINNLLTIMQSGRNLQRKKNVQTSSTDRDTTIGLATVSMSGTLSELEPLIQQAVSAAVTVVTEELSQIWRSNMAKFDVHVNKFGRRMMMMMNCTYYIVPYYEKTSQGHFTNIFPMEKTGQIDMSLIVS